jgi:hypothetical protein
VGGNSATRYLIPENGPRTALDPDLRLKAAGQQETHVDREHLLPVCRLGESRLEFGSPHWQRMEPLMRPATE